MVRLEACRKEGHAPNTPSGPVHLAPTAATEASAKVCHYLIVQVVCSVVPPLIKLTPNLHKRQSPYLWQSRIFSRFRIYLPPFSTCDNQAVPTVSVHLEGGTRICVRALANSRAGENGAERVSPVGLTSLLRNMQTLALSSVQQRSKFFLWLTAHF